MEDKNKSNDDEDVKDDEYDNEDVNNNC